MGGGIFGVYKGGTTGMARMTQIIPDIFEGVSDLLKVDYFTYIVIIGAGIIATIILVKVF